MGLKKLNLSVPLHIAFIALLSSLACICFQNSSNFFSHFIDLNIPFHQENENTWEGNISSIPNGNYFISLGRPRRTCGLYLDNALLDSATSSFSKVRSKLTLGAGFSVDREKNNPQKIRIHCEEQKGFNISASNLPVISNYTAGTILQYWRGLIDAAIGPIFSLILLFVMLMSGEFLAETKNDKLRCYAFGGTAFIYSLSIAHYPRLILDDSASTLVHILLKTIYSLSFIFLFEEFTKKNTLLKLVHTLAILCTINVYFLDPLFLDQYYNIQYALYPLSALVLLINTFKNRPKRRTHSLFQYLTFTFLFVQMWDYILLLKQFSFSYTAPAHLTLIVCLISYYCYKESLRLRLSHELAHFEMIRMSEVSELATQLAHDIRSPLLVLKMVVPKINSVNAQERELLNSSLDRICEIADNLLAEGRKRKNSLNSIELLTAIESLITAKKLQYGENIVIFNNNKELFSLHSFQLNLNASELKRMLSNLINNAIDSLSPEGNVAVDTALTGNKFTIRIKDNGKGIPQAIQSQLMQRGVSFGKSNGNGLGLFYARKLMEACNGSISLKSQPNLGTTVTLVFPINERITKEKQSTG